MQAPAGWLPVTRGNLYEFRPTTVTQRKLAIDAANLLKDYSSSDFLREPGEVGGEVDDRALVELLVEQIEFADVIV